jgi:hypothetical protein
MVYQIEYLFYGLTTGIGLFGTSLPFRGWGLSFIYQRLLKTFFLIAPQLWEVALNLKELKAPWRV